MKTWMIPTHNDPLGAVRRILQTIWNTTDLNSILLPLNSDINQTGPCINDNLENIQRFNPFIPIMAINAAQMIPELVNHGEPVAAVLRPCELRTLKGMSQRNMINTENLLTISIDCLGTLPVDEFKWRLQRKGNSKDLTQEALQFARQGGIVPYRFRAACQICENPNADLADININILGLPVRQYLIICIKNSRLASFIDMDNLIPVDSQLQQQHLRVVSRLLERGRDTRQRIYKGLELVLPSDINSFMEFLNRCDECRICMDTCPLCTNDLPGKDATGSYHREDIVDWLVSCSECGMCEQSCPKHLPLTIIFGHIRNLLSQNNL